MQCPKCLANSTDPLVCSECGVIFSKFEKSQSTYIPRKIPEFQEVETRKIPIWVEMGLPIAAFLLAPLFKVILPGPAFTWIHEFGHASAAWFGGVRAIPLPMGWTNWGGEREWAVTICFTILIGLLGYLSWQKRSYFLMTILSLIFVAQIYFRFFLSMGELEAMIVWMGTAGEFWISALFVIAYQFQLPKEIHWHPLRYLFLFLGAASFFVQMQKWIQISKGLDDMRMGHLVMITGAHLKTDTLRLVEDWAWTEAEIIQSYLSLGKICIVVMIINYIAHWTMELVKKNSRV